MVTSSRSCSLLPWCCCLSCSNVFCLSPWQDPVAIGNTPEDERRRRPSFAAGPSDLTRVCAALPRVRVQRVDAFKDGQGPTVGRYHMQQMLQDEEFFFQVMALCPPLRIDQSKALL